MNITTEVLAELERAMRKFPTWPTDPLHALAVLGEEFGELTKDVLQLTYEPHKTNTDNVRKEAIQTAAMALRFAASLDRYSYLPGDQHAQEASAFGVLGRQTTEENP
jgi:NTP pyrophosphatase (non-canonical NTP hydrolase)